MTDYIVEFNEVSKLYKQVNALQAVSFNLKKGEVLGLFGHNGAGKTTLMKIILGIINQTSGDVSVFGASAKGARSTKNHQHLGYLPENVSFYDQLTGFDVLYYFAQLKGQNKKQVKELIEQVGLTHAMNRVVKTYSKGMRQRLGLAQAFLGKPKLLLLDEPTVGLDPVATTEFYQTVDQLKSNGTSVILCSHVLPGAEKHIDRAMILSQGKKLALGSLQELREQAQLPVTIKTTGLNGYLADDTFLKQYCQDDQNHILKVPEDQKIEAIKILTQQSKLTNIEIEPASLSHLYQHYLSQTAVLKKENRS